MSAHGPRMILKARDAGAKVTLRVVSAEVEGVDRPRKRRDCEPGGNGPHAQRPCPWVSCRSHLALHVTAIGAIYETFPGREIDELPATCSLDEAALGGLTLTEVGERTNLTRERARQIEVFALKRVAAQAGAADGLATWLAQRRSGPARCRGCRGPVPVGANGRPRQWCTTKCRVQTMRSHRRYASDAESATAEGTP